MHVHGRSSRAFVGGLKKLIFRLRNLDQSSVREGVTCVLRGGIVSLSAIVFLSMLCMSYHQAYRGGLGRSLTEGVWIAGESGGVCSFDEQGNRNQEQNRQA